VGNERFCYDIYGDTVNTGKIEYSYFFCVLNTKKLSASRMQTLGYSSVVATEEFVHQLPPTEGKSTCPPERA
jgi:hypothetical protein